MSIALHPDLADHIGRQQIRLPKKSILYDFRLSLDFASMLYARKHIFNETLDYHLHLRLDSSPQFNRNYLVGEVDLICLTAVNPANIDSVWLGG